MIINFHQLTEYFDPQFHMQGTWTNIHNFEIIITALKEKFKIVSLTEGISIVKQNKLKDKLLAITFDDGDVSIQNVVPILKKHKLPASFFINSAYLANKRYGYQLLSYLKANKDKYGNKFDFLISNFQVFRNTSDNGFYNDYRKMFMDLRSSVKENINFVVNESFLSGLDETQFEIGLHGHEHERYSMMSPEWQLSDIRNNIDILSSFKAYKPVFAIPFGKSHDWDDNTIKIALELKLDFLFQDSGINFKKSVGFKRVPADGKTVHQLLYNSIN